MKAGRWRVALILFGVLLVSDALASDIQWQERADFSRIFVQADVIGTVVVFDETGQNWLVHDPIRAEAAYSPASTFKVFNALAALESGAVSDEYEVIRWDGQERRMPAWNRDHSLASGMRYSVVWFYQAVARRIGAKRMQAYLDAVDYGNRSIGDTIDQFWLDNSLRISARQQVDFLRRLADGKLPFTERSQEAVRRITISTDAPGWILHQKTGWSTRGAADGKTDLGWSVGWLERDGRRWFFAINIDMPAADDATKRLSIPLRLLESIGAFGPDR
ncbi:class D beta-lactamase [Dokdonella sp.]|uniref:class D beta-lactamase n=1 Tax=Dokdonella sp. TaxID=2291710 RepID=UPI003527653D